MIPAQVDEYCEIRRLCGNCRRQAQLKDYRRLKFDTEFGTVSVRSPKLMSCPCQLPLYLEVLFRPLSKIISKRAALLQLRRAAQMPCRQVVVLMKEFLPGIEKLNHVTARIRALRICVDEVLL